MRDDAKRFFVLTGGPGSGKSTLMAKLERAGYFCSVEAGRAVIQDQVASGGNALPWSDRRAFAKLMLSWELRSYRAAQRQEKPAFFDRGVPDVAGYLRLSGLPLPKHVDEAARTYRYNQRVFIAPPWPEIFEQDSQRKQDFTEAVRTYDAMVSTYTGYGYDLIELPRVAPDERLRFVLSIGTAEA